MLTSEHPEQNIVLQSFRNVPIVPVQQPLTPQEVERMCKAFIKLITAQERPPENKQHTKQPQKESNQWLQQ